MKLLLKQYLASLNERDELDVVLPDIMSEVGYTVISRPKRGPSQYGVDVAALGTHPKTGEKALFLLSIKSGDLTRSEWASGNQALRPSLEELIEFYIPKLVPTRYQSLPKVIALCFGGDIRENARSRVDAFIDKNTTPGEIEFAEWNGDYIANMISTGLLRENIFPKSMQRSFRKAVAFADEPAICVSHFSDLIRLITETSPAKVKDRLPIARQIYLATWTIFVWCRDAENLEAAYRCGTLATLQIWDLCNAHFGNSKNARALAEVVEKTISLSRIIGEAFIHKHVVPFTMSEDGLAVSVPSGSSIDINLKLFEMLGRVALHGLWLTHSKSLLPGNANPKIVNQLDKEIFKTRDLIVAMIENNQAYFTPLKDDHAIEITVTGLFLMQCEAYKFLSNWVDQITLSSIFSYRNNIAYPCVFQDYSDLAQHPKSTIEYKEEATIGSILYPTLAVWLAIFQNRNSFDVLAAFQSKDMAHSTWQIWIPDVTSEHHYYKNSDIHGAGITDLDLSKGPDKFLEQLKKEIIAFPEFDELSANQWGYWPIIFMASQTYRLPTPPHYLSELY